MFGTHFYNEGLRKLTIAFGQLFNNIVIQNTSSTGAVTKRIRVPLAYAPKEKFIVRLEQQANLQSDREVSITLPRLGFEITGLSYDSTRKLNKMNKTIRVKNNEEGKKTNFNYTPVPYNINFELAIISKNQDDGLQIIEQILPYFQPHYNLSVKLLTSVNEIKDVPVVLTNVEYEDDYEGDFSTRRAIIYTLQFTAKTYLYGPVTESKIIKKAVTDYYTDTNVTRAPRQVRYTATPTSLVDRDGVVVTTLSNATDTNDNIITVADASSIAKFDNIYIDTELLRVSKKDGNALTVVRGFEDSTAAAHASGANIYKVDTTDAALLDTDDDFGFGELYSEFTDYKKRNPISGADEAI